MTVRDLIEKLSSMPQDMHVEAEGTGHDGFRDTFDVTDVRIESVTRGIALPEPRTYDIVVLMT